MGTGYTRNDSANNIADGNVINASDLDGEFDAVQAAFNGSTGHTHDGTTGEGPKIDTAGLADDAVTGAKIDSTTTITAAGFTGPLTGTASNAALLDNIDSTSFLRSDAADTKTSGDLSFSDNVKAIFGAGNDLQIYHDESNSYISESGTGNLFLGATNLFMRSSTGETYIGAVQDGAVTLYHNNNAKLATTSTGISVTGGVVASGGLSINSYGDPSNNYITLRPGFAPSASGGVGFAAKDHDGANNDGLAVFGHDGISFTSGGSERMRIDSSGVVTVNSGTITAGASGTSGQINAPESFVVNIDSDNNSTTRAFVIKNNGSAEIARFTESGRLGLGTTSPSVDLDLTSSRPQISFGNTTSSQETAVGYDSDNTSFYVRNIHAGNVDFWTNNVRRMRINSSGNVGIGTTSPSQRLHVHGGAVQFTNTQNTYLQINTADTHLYTAAAHPLRFGTNSTERMRIDSSGNLLVGKTSVDYTTVGFEATPSSAFQANAMTADGKKALLLARKTSDGDIVEFRKNTTAVGSIGTLGSRMYVGSGDIGVFFDSTNNAITPYSTDANDTVDNAIDLGLSSRRYKDLRLSGRVYATHIELAASGSFINFENSNTSIKGSATNGYLRFLTSGSERMRLDASGNMLLGTSSSFSQGERLAISYNYLSGTGIVIDSGSGGGAALRFRTNSSLVGSIITGTSSTTYNTTSDIRLKTDIAPISDATDKLMAMNAVTHKWKADPDADAVVGFIAQEMQEIVPEAVSKGDSEDDMWSMDYGRITPVLVAALQDAHKKIEQLEQRIADMENN